jgi:hypothetical protein
MDQEITGKIWENIIRGLSQALSRKTSEETEGNLEETRDNKSLKKIQTQYLPSSVLVGDDRPTCPGDFETLKAT